MSPARRAHSSKPAARCCSGRLLGQTDGRTDGRTPYRYIDPAAYYASSACVTGVTNANGRRQELRMYEFARRMRFCK